MSDHTPQLPDTHLPTKYDYDSLVHFRRWGLQPPAGVYVTVDDVLILRSQASTAPVTVNVSARLQTPDGQIVPMFRAFVVSAIGGPPSTFTLQMVEGFLLSVTVATPGVPTGVCFCAVEIQRGVGTGDVTGGHLLCAGYPGTNWKIGFPQTPAISPSTSLGQTLPVIGIAPAPGTEFSFVTQAGTQTTLVSLHLGFITSAAVANRLPSLLVKEPGGSTLFKIPIGAGQAASLNYDYTWAANITAGGSAPSFAAGIPAGVRLAGGSTIQTSTTALQAADQYTGPTLVVQQVIDS